MFKLAHRYQVQHIQDYAARAIHFAMEVENCVEIAIMANLYEDQDLLEDALKVGAMPENTYLFHCKCYYYYVSIISMILQMIKANLQEIKKSASWHILEDKHPKLITKMLTDAGQK